jgi:hypothetical protein
MEGLVLPEKVRTPMSAITNSLEQLSLTFLALIQPHRAHNETSWREIGQALYTYHAGKPSGLEAWIRFSQNSPHSEEECRHLYRSFHISHNIQTLAQYAREDSPQAYDAWHQSWCQEALRWALTCCHADVARALYRIHWLDYCCNSISQLTWYQYQNQTWVQLPTDRDVSPMMWEDLIQRYNSFLDQTIQELHDHPDKEVQVTIKRLKVILDKLKSVSYRQCVMREAVELFYRPNQKSTQCC